MNDNGNGNAVGGELDKVTTKKMSSHENEEDAPSSEEVQPSSMLIDILHHKLRDPSIVRKFEDNRQDSSTYGLICPRWVLQQAAKSDVAKDDISKLNGTNNIKVPNSNNNREMIYNAYPKRNYIDLRMEQNRMFANEQHQQCRVLLAKLSQPSTTSQSTPSSNNIDTNNNKQWKKQADTIQSRLNEGLASCPNHVGLLQAEKEYKEWIQKRINILSTPSLPTTQTATVDKSTPSNITLLPNSHSSNMKKGAEKRAQAALRDAQLERSFMLDGDTKDDKKDDNNNMYPLLSAHDDQHEDINGGGSYNNKEESLSSGSDIDEDSRRRKKSKHKYKKHKRSKSRHGHDDGRRRRKRDRRSRSRSMSRSHSKSSSSSQSSDSYRRRKHRRKERKRRKKKKRRKHRDSRSTRYSSEEDKGSKDEKQVERSI